MSNTNSELPRFIVEQPHGEQEPICWVTGYYGGRCTVAPRNGATVLPVGMALYDHSKKSAVTNRENIAEKALEEILSIILEYLPPDGLDPKSTLSRIIGVIDPWPLYMTPKQKNKQD